MTKVKICGITNLADAQLAVDLGADMLGFNFFRGSKRFVAETEARTIGDQIKGDVIKVGIIVNEDLDAIADMIKFTGMNLIQLHGEEDPAYVSALRGHRLGGLIKAFRVGQCFDPAVIGECAIDTVLLDSDSGTSERGGTGKTFDWAISNCTELRGRNLILAGGLNPENVAEAIRAVRPWAVDVASGVESEPGKKDPKKLEAFIKNAKNA